jgi:hypothetical protein
VSGTAEYCGDNRIKASILPALATGFFARAQPFGFASTVSAFSADAWHSRIYRAPASEPDHQVENSK